MTAKPIDRAEKARNLRYKKPALFRLGWEFIRGTLAEIEEACCDVRYFIENDEDSLIAAMYDDEDEEWEFKMAFGELEAECDQLRNAIDDQYGIEEYFDDCTVALIGNRVEMLGYDDYQEDYYALTGYEADLALTEAGKRVCRWTKAEMLANIGQCMGIVLAMLNLEQKYDYLKAVMDIIRGDNLSMLKVVKQIESLYERVTCDWPSKDDVKAFDSLLRSLPERTWIE